MPLRGSLRQNGGVCRLGPSIRSQANLFSLLGKHYHHTPVYKRKTSFLPRSLRKAGDAGEAWREGSLSSPEGQASDRVRLECLPGPHAAQETHSRWKEPHGLKTKR